MSWRSCRSFVDASAVEGCLLYNHADAEHGSRQLILVAAFHHAVRLHRRQIADVLWDHNVLFYDETALDQLAADIAATAH